MIEQHGYPVVSKQVSNLVSRYRGTKSQHQRDLIIKGGLNENTNHFLKRPRLSKKHQYLIDAPFKISESCCDILKKKPFSLYNKTTNTHPYIGVMAADSAMRERSYTTNGCNVFKEGHLQSRPIMIWNDADIWEYIKYNKLPYSTIYDYGIERTGCTFCLFGYGVQSVDRFDLLKKLHPKMHNYCMDNLGFGDVISYLRK